ncbi:hypothetical protein FRB97_001373 [Tulasnella sp. 331]|nr:hypothetical protein FRB97_001373 [Tulasnella sp. 331]
MIPLSRRLILSVTRRSAFTSTRFLSSQPLPTQTFRSRFSRKAFYAATLSFGALAITLAPPPGVVEEPTIGALDTRPKQESMSALIRTYVVYSLCSIPPVVTYAPAALSFCQSIPGVKQIVEAVVRVTFFNQFVGADTAEETIPLLRTFREQNKGVMLVYSVEVDEKVAKSQSSPVHGDRDSGPAQYRKNVEEIIHSIEVAGDFEDQYNVRAKGVAGRTTWVALKLLVHYPGTPQPKDLDILYLTTPPVNSPLTTEDLDALKTLREDLGKICTRAKERNVKIVMDAEYTWYQAAIDAIQLSLMREFNTVGEKFGTQGQVQPLVYGTYQAYLRRNTMHLLRSLELAQKENFILGVKLVRGAYHEKELEIPSPYQPDTQLIQKRLEVVIPSSAHAVRHPKYEPSSSAASPVWNEKWDTDGAFNGAALMLVDQLKRSDPHVGVMFATHNKESCDIAIRAMVSEGLARVEKGTSTVRVDDRIVDRVSFGQLYGMSDALTNHLANTLVSPSPMTLKYLPYGSLAEVIPYLGRRAIENKSVLGAAEGGAADEKRRAGKEIWRRLTGGQ